ncbi:MAG: hypothetical protein WKG01_12035 [Kofleriaceae bacterium]
MRVVGTSILAIVFAVTSVAAQPAPDVERAKTLYDAAQTATAEARYADAIRDYTAAYDITKDPALLFKIGAAHQKSGGCELALTFFRRYLAEGKPSEPYVNLTKDRIVACGGDPAIGTEPAPVEPAPAEPAPVEPAPVEPAPTPVAPAPAPPMLGRHRLAWLLVGGSIGLLTVGSVLAYSSNAAERDIEDLYVGLGGTPPRFDDRTRARYEAVVDEGEKYEKLSWISFGIAGGLAVAATVRFLTDREGTEPLITPTVSPTGAGASATFRF